MDQRKSYATKIAKKNNLKEDFRNLLKNAPCFIFLGTGVMNIIFNIIRDGVAMNYFKYHIIDETAVSISKMTFAIGILYLFFGQAANILGVVMAKPFSAAIGKRKTFMYAMFGAVFFSSPFFFLGKGDVLLIYILELFVSFCAGIIFPLLWSMYADSSDWSEWKTARRATGLVFSASSMNQKLGWILGGAVTLWLLAAYGFIANVDQNPETIKEKNSTVHIKAIPNDGYVFDKFVDMESNNPITITVLIILPLYLYKMRLLRRAI
ncbi:MAG: MFS transporter [Prolixibacteraceae bacterium]